MGNTNYYALVGYAHLRGNRETGPYSLDPLAGVQLTTTGESQAPELNTIVFGATSGARARVTRVGQNGKHEVQMLQVWSAILATSVPLAFQAGEALTYDSGGTATAGNFVVPVAAPAGILNGTGRHAFDGQFLTGIGDLTINTPVPNNGVADNDYPWWDKSAKSAREITVTGATGNYYPGDRYSNGTGEFTVLKATDGGGGAWTLWIIRATGTEVAVADTITAVTVGATGDGSVGTVGADPSVGMWLPWYPFPNWSGLADQFEFVPRCEATDGKEASLGPGRTFVRDCYDHHQLEADDNDKNARVSVISLNDYRDEDSFNVGGVSTQVLEFAAVDAGWTLGETITCAATGFSAVFIGATATRLYVKGFNGVAVNPGDTLVGDVSATTDDAEGPLYGFQKGCHNYNEMLDEFSDSYGADNALFNSQARQWQGIALWIWETEISPYVADITFGVVTFDEMRAAWNNLLSDLRTDLSNAQLPVAIVKPPITYQGPGAPGMAYILATEVMEKLENVDTNVSLVSPQGWEAGHSSQTLLTAPLGKDIVTWMRTMDYLEAGSRIWRALRFAQYVPPVGAFLPLPIVFTAGQSQGVSFLGASAFAADADDDPDLYKSADFSAANGWSTLDPLVFMWNARDQVQEWQAFDVLVNGNSFQLPFQNGAEGKFSGLHCALQLRMKKRFGEGGESTEIGMIHLNVSGSAASAHAHIGNGCWDPAAGPQDERDVASCSVTPLAGPSRGRFTGSAGSFTGWGVNDMVVVSGSALGNIGVGGNNHVDGNGTRITSVAADGSYIDLALYNDLPFVAEGPLTLTFTHGAKRLWPLARDQIRSAMEKCVTELNRLPRLKAFVWWQGQGDFGYPDAISEHEAVLGRIFDEVHKEFGSGQTKGETPAASVLMRVGANTPLGSDDDLAAIRTAQEAFATARANCTWVDTDDLPLGSSGVWPRTSRQDNEAHLTLRGSVMGGYRADEALGTLDGIPAHPDGSAAQDFGSVGGGFTTDDAEDTVVDSGSTETALTDGATGSGGGISAGDSQSVLDAIDQAVLQGGDVASYTVNGRTVTLRSLTELIAARRYYEAQKARAKGVRYTKVAF